MPRIVRLVWRLDYKNSYAYLDKRGSALGLLSDTIQDFWDTIGYGGAVPSSFVAQHTDASGLRTFSLEPTCMNGSIEWSAGIDIERVFRDEAFRGTDKIVHELLKLCEVRAMTRAGIRVFCLAKFADGRREGFRRVSKLLDQEFSLITVDVLGNIDDLAIILEGTTNDNIGYRASFGPYARKNVEMNLQKKLEILQYEKFDENDLFFDIDLFENNISFIEHSLYRWANTKIEKAAEFIALSEATRAAALRA